MEETQGKEEKSDGAAWYAARCRDTAAVLAAVARLGNIMHGATVARVGAWVWVTFREKPEAVARAALRAEGFSWNGTRGCWQNPCGVFRKRAPKGYDPRERYGNEIVRAASLA